MVGDYDYGPGSRDARQLGLVDAVSKAFPLDQSLDEGEAIEAVKPPALVEPS
jgi:hypothetical protein